MWAAECKLNFERFQKPNWQQTNEKFSWEQLFQNTAKAEPVKGVMFRI